MTRRRPGYGWRRAGRADTVRATGDHGGRAGPPSDVEVPVAGDEATMPDRPAEAAAPAGTDPARRPGEPGDPAAPPGARPVDSESATGRFGAVGKPFRRNAFLVGFLGGLGLLLAYAVYLGLRNAASILVLIF